MTMHREQEITIKAGEKFSVVFNEASTAGYLWKVSENKSNLDVQALSVMTPRAKLRKAAAIGGFNQIEFSARVAQAGTYEVEFAHKRPWEDKAHETVRVKLTVR
jgi:predicted secreted protein